MSDFSRWPSVLVRLARGDTGLMKALNALRRAIRRGTLDDVAAVVGAMGAAERRAVGEQMPALLKAVRKEYRWIDGDQASRLLLAGAGTISGPAAAAAWVCRAELRSWGGPQAETAARTVAKVLKVRSPEWRADFTRRVAERMDGRRRDEPDTLLWHLVDRLARDAGDGPPPGEAYLLGWLMWGPPPGATDGDPFLEALVPRLFEADLVGERLRWELTANPPQRTRLADLVRLAGEGRLGREALLDGCLGRMLRGGRDGDLRWFAALHDRLEPTVSEAEARLRDHLRLLPTAPVSVAEMAFRQVQRVDEASALDGASFAEAAEALLFRPEKRLVRAALTWLNKTARTRGRVDATLQAVTAAFAVEDLVLRERAVKIAVRHAPKAGEQARDAVRAAAADLPADLRVLVAECCGPVDAAPAGPPPVPAPPPFVPQPRPVPITSPAELAEEVNAVLAGYAEHPLPVLERLLAGITEQARHDADATRRALKTVVPEWARDYSNAAHGGWVNTFSAVLHAVSAVLFPEHRSTAPGDAAREAFLHGRKIFAEYHSDPLPSRFISWRVHAAVHAIGRTPTLLATPTEANGQIDPDVLVHRMALLERAGFEPDESDLEQALLRIPREIDPGAVARVRALASPAAKTLAERLAAGALPDPVVTCSARTLPRPGRFSAPPYGHRDVPTARVLPSIVMPEDASPVTARLCRLPVYDEWTCIPVGHIRGDITSWPFLFPSHREVAAAHLLPFLPDWTESRHGQGAALLSLAEADGPAGPATAHALAYGLAARHKQERSAAVDALLVLSARAHLPAAELGAAVPALLAMGEIKLNRVVDALADAATAGAHADVWTIVRTALPDLLPAPGRRPATGLADLIALGARTAETTRARASIPALAALASRGGTSRLAREAARLHTLLTT
ncbi:DUF7824 domain-containing protein [Thermomonospora cellulosilytica]|uniref:DUF7824 domain-containing protein n=1 Tax=Thermomonospora cellulosilytica TaxID=1411118 RepID=A0A7W3MZD4_9ACTN|nr:DUF6493 family protein [Thermomonospora cellulosilytica]MBA9004692.1 hypothetical protein [Thermomonospora cellulosilytica]